MLPLPRVRVTHSMQVFRRVFEARAILGACRTYKLQRQAYLPVRASETG